MGRFRALAYGHRRRTALGVDGGQESLRILGTGLLPLPDLCSGEVHDATLGKFLLRQTPLQRKKEEEERNKEEEEQFLEQSMQELRLLSKLAPANEQDDGAPQAPRRSLFLVVLEEEEEKDSSSLFPSFATPRSSSTTAVVCAGWFCWLRYTSCCVSVYCQCPWRFHRCSSWSR